MRKRKQIKIFPISPYIEYSVLPKFKTFWTCNFPLKLSREVVVCIEGMAFIFITYFFYFNYFYFNLLIQKIITSLQKKGRLKRPPPPLLQPLAPAPSGLLQVYAILIFSKRQINSSILRNSATDIKHFSEM